MAHDRRTSWIDRNGARCAFVLLIAWTALFYRELLFENQIHVYRDNHSFILPMHHTGHLLGQWGWPPLWNPLQALGKPFAADIQNAVYYPVSWVLRGFAEPLGFNLGLAIHHIIAATGMFLLLRRWRASTLASSLGALVFSYGGLLVAFDNMANALQSAAWAPWTLLAFDLWLESRSLVALAGVAAFVGLTTLGAMPEVVLFENAAIVAMAWDRRRFGLGPGLPRCAAAISIANLLAFCLCGAQLIPFLEYVGQSSRAGGLSVEAATRFSLAPVGIIAFFLPRRLSDANGSFSELATAWESNIEHLPWAITLYLGVALVLVPCAWNAVSRQRAWLWSSFVIAFLLLSFGCHLPGYSWLLEQIPSLRSVRYPEKFLLVVHFGLATAIAFGLEQCLDNPAVFRRLQFVAGVFALGALLSGAILGATAKQYAHQVWSGDLFALAAFAGAVTLAACLGGRQPRAAAMAIVVLVALDLFRATDRLLPTLPYDTFLTRPMTLSAMEQSDSPLRIYSNATGRNRVPIHPDSVFQEHELMLAEQASFHGVGNLFAPASINLSDHEKLEVLVTGSRRDRVSRLLASFNTAYLTSQRPLGYPGLTLVQEARNPIEANVYRIEDVEPRAYVPRETLAFDDIASALLYLNEADDPAHQVAATGSSIPDDGPSPASGSVRIVSYLPDRVELEATMQTPGMVMLSDTFYPGWSARVNDVPTEIVRANAFARGVFVDAGRQRIVFQYAPTSHTLGKVLTTISVLLVTAGILLESRRRRRPLPWVP